MYTTILSSILTPRISSLSPHSAVLTISEGFSVFILYSQVGTRKVNGVLVVSYNESPVLLELLGIRDCKSPLGIQKSGKCEKLSTTKVTSDTVEKGHWGSCLNLRARARKNLDKIVNAYGETGH